MKFKSIFSYYGGKGALSHLYPPPKHDLIIEPFAGAANYSLRYAEREVILIDNDPVVADIWRFLLRPDALDICRDSIPRLPSVGDRVSELLGDQPEPGLLRLLQSYANVGTQGAKGVHDQITKFGIKGWSRIIHKLEYFLPRIKHWRFNQMSYYNQSNPTATWFIDPPYNNAAGRRYRQHDIDYGYLADWCKHRQGQVIVCENAGADWLPFTPLAPRRGVKSSYQKSTAMEVVWTNEVSHV